LTLQCDESNEMLREVYQSYITRAESMSGPTAGNVLLLVTFSHLQPVVLRCLPRVPPAAGGSQLARMNYIT